LHVAFKIPYAYDFIIKLCRQPAYKWVWSSHGGEYEDGCLLGSCCV
jgi:hypothetical protein